MMIAINVILCHFHRFQLLQAGFLSYLVLPLISIMLKMTYISDIPHITYFIADMLKVSEQNVKGNGRTCVTQMRVAIYSGATYIHAYMRCMQWGESFFLSAQCVVNNQISHNHFYYRFKINMSSM